MIHDIAREDVRDITYCTLLVGVIVACGTPLVVIHRKII